MKGQCYLLTMITGQKQHTVLQYHTVMSADECENHLCRWLEDPDAADTVACECPD